MPNHEGLPLKAQDNSREAYNSIHDEPEYQKELQRKRVNAIYSSVLTLISFQERKKPEFKEPLVTPYYEKALRDQKRAERIAKKEALEAGEPVRKIEKIPGENPKDRKNYAYLERLDLAIERGGNKLEKRIWQESIKNFAPIIEKENINNKSWLQLKKAFDDNRKGQGLPPIEYTESEMNKDYERLRQDQVDSINSWTEYLSNKEVSFPTWFKIYTFNSVIKMGRYNQLDGKYENRDKSTIAPYPKVSPAALALTLDAVNDFFGQDKEKWFTEHTDDDQLNAIVKSGNFGKIYTHFFKETYKPIPTPERTEDIKGEWFDFYPGQETELAEAAQGTPWCIASEHQGAYYLKTNLNIANNKARFKLFKLENESSVDGMSKTACASIRFNTEGKVDEISGLKNGDRQTIEDSLIPIVEQEVLKYPLNPEKHFKEKFRDKKELIRLQDKAKKGEEITLDEYAFLYEKNREIFTLDTYKGPDLKIAELRNIYNLSRLLQGEDKDAIDQDLLIQKLECVLEKTSSNDIVANFDTLLEKGFDINTILNKMDSHGISCHIDTLLEKGIDINAIFNKLNSDDVSQSLDTLLEKGFDINTIFNKLDSHGISYNIDTFLEKGIDINTIFNKLNSHDVSQNLNTLLENGIDINTIFNKLDSYNISRTLDALLENGIDINTIFNKLDSYDITKNLTTLLENGIDVNVIFDKLDSYDITKNLDTFLEKGINFNTIFNKLGSYGISQSINTLLENGIDINVIFDKLDSYGVSYHLDTLLENGIDINAAFNKLDSYGVSQNLNTLLENGVDVNRVFNRLNSDGISLNFELLANHDIPINLLISKMNLQGIESHLDTIQTDPADIKAAQSIIYRDVIIDGIEEFSLENINYDVIYDKILDNQLDLVIKGGNLELAMNKVIEETLSGSLKTFLEQHPTDFNNIKPELYSKLVSEFIESYIDSDEAVRLNDDRVIRSLVGPDLIYNLNNLLQVMSIDRIVANMRPADIETYHDELVAHGATL
ncbi:MAG: hypothetical protein ACFN3A_00235 [Candidatus Nanosyncoccus sp.]